MMLVKLGGSVITDKSMYMTFREDTMVRLAREIKNANEPVVLVHGAGSFGHVVASEHQLQHGFKEKSQIAGLAQVLADVRELDLKVLRALDAENVPALPCLHPLSRRCGTENCHPLTWRSSKDILTWGSRQ